MTRRRSCTCCGTDTTTVGRWTIFSEQLSPNVKLYGSAAPLLQLQLKRRTLDFCDDSCKMHTWGDEYANLNRFTVTLRSTNSDCMLSWVWFGIVFFVWTSNPKIIENDWKYTIHITDSYNYKAKPAAQSSECVIFFLKTVSSAFHLKCQGNLPFFTALPLNSLLLSLSNISSATEVKCFLNGPLVTQTTPTITLDHNVRWNL